MSDTTVMDTGTGTTDAGAGTGTDDAVAIAAAAAATQAAAEQATADATQKAVATVPETYDIAFAQGVTGDAALIEKTTATARELGLSNDQAQALLNFTATQVSELSAKAAADALASYKPGGAEYTKMETGWRELALADAEIGGTPEKLAQSVELSKKVLGTFGSEGLQTFLHESGLGSHPAVFKFLCAVGKATGESKFIPGGNTGDTTRKSDEEVFYSASLASHQSVQST